MENYTQMGRVLEKNYFLAHKNPRFFSGLTVENHQVRCLVFPAKSPLKPSQTNIFFCQICKTVVTQSSLYS